MAVCPYRAILAVVLRWRPSGQIACSVVISPSAIADVFHMTETLRQTSCSSVDTTPLHGEGTAGLTLL